MYKVYKVYKVYTEGHPFFRAAVDLRLKAVPRCPKSAMLAILYNTTIRFGFDFSTKLSTLYGHIGDNRVYKRCMELIEESPYRYQRSLGPLPTEKTSENLWVRCVPSLMFLRLLTKHFSTPTTLLVV